VFPLVLVALKYFRPCAHLVFISISGDLITSGQSTPPGFDLS